MRKNKKVQTMSVREFLRNEPARPAPSHFEKYGVVYKVVGATVVILIAGGGFDYALAASAIDAGAQSLYYEIIGIGKWVIVFKGGFDAIKSVGNGDFDSAKKTFFSHVLVYLMLLGLPYAMDKVDDVFHGIATS
ncbi:hypothetical protein [Cytobacillus gottheilii]|uniref:Uncharacterized protein n=1 Tax=Cytobacillus gottheilii TaxID=859144 RepID=A0ABX8FG70_9BACI|nr:hypothetical protein [Cytobacillus gottheilii]QVY63007.1 hypothetical protein J1899_08185 [Cytobacillus gottheilii]